MSSVDNYARLLALRGLGEIANLETLLTGMLARPEAYGVVDDPDIVIDQTAKVQDWLTACGINGYSPCVPEMLTVKITGPVTYIPQLGLTAYKYSRPPADFRNLNLVPTNSTGGLIIGRTSDQFRNTTIYLPSVAKLVLSWPSTLLGTDVAILVHNASNCIFYRQFTYGCTVGFALKSTGFDCNYNLIVGGRLVDNKYNEILLTESPGNSINENIFFGGSLSFSSDSISMGDGWGTVITWNGVDSYRGQNNNRWLACAYEVGNPASATVRTPIWADGCGVKNLWDDQCRFEDYKGPLALFDGSGEGSFSEGAASQNTIHAGYTATGYLVLQNVGGAYGNVLLSPEVSGPIYWHSGPAKDCLKTAGTTNGAYIKPPFFTKRAADSLPYRSSNSDDLRSNTKVFQSKAGGGIVGLWIEVDSTSIKDFRLFSNAVSGFGGRVMVQGFDFSGAILTGTVTDSYGTERYLKLQDGASTTLFLGGQITQSDGRSGMWLTVREEVKKIHIGFLPGTNELALEAISVVGYPRYQDLTGQIIYARALGISNPLSDNGSIAIATQLPTIAGKHGYYAEGEIVSLSSATGWADAGSVCTSPGWLAHAWQITTVYSVLGRVVTNDGGKTYELKVAGTSAGAGGPTGTGSTIVDGSCTWAYIGTLSVFA